MEYSGNIHQLRRWSQELLGYEFPIIHHVARMMKDVDGLSRHIDILIHCHLTQAARMRADDVAQRPSVYSYNTFNTCSNPRRITTSNVTIVTKSSSLLPALSIIHHSPINFTSMYTVQSYPINKPTSHNFHHIVPQKTSFGYLLTPLPPLSYHYSFNGQEELLLFYYLR